MTTLRRVATGIVIGTGAAVIAWLTGLAPFMQTIESKTYDLRVRTLTDPSPATVSGVATIVQVAVVLAAAMVIGSVQSVL